MTPAISFEIFPPATDPGREQLARTTRRLDSVAPSYVSVTFGAGGSDREKSFTAIQTVSDHSRAPIAGHLTCVGQPIREVEAVIDRYEQLGVRHIVALRGDPPTGVGEAYTPHPDGFGCTADLVAAIKRRPGFSVSVSAYPERHPQSPTDDHDLDVLAQKVDAGADQAMTQMFFDNRYFFAYRDRLHARGVDIPVVPGIFPIHSFPKVAGFAERCGTTMPSHVARRFTGLDGDETATRRIGAQFAAEQILELADQGVEQVHLYTLNRADLALEVCALLGIRPIVAAGAA